MSDDSQSRLDEIAEAFRIGDDWKPGDFRNALEDAQKWLAEVKTELWEATMSPRSPEMGAKVKALHSEREALQKIAKTLRRALIATSSARQRRGRSRSDEADEHRVFVNVAKEMLPRETYLSIWEKVIELKCEIRRNR
jgi:hypothetical protein